MWPFSLFSKQKDPDNFETVLEDLRISIALRRQRLAEMRLRERRATLWTTLYLMAAWIVYAGVWYAGWIYALAGVNRSNPNAMLWTKTLITAPVFVGPVVILFTRRIVQLWYTRIANGEEKTLKTLLLEQRAKLEQLKKKTDFYSTQKLLERYDRPDGAAPNPNANPANANANATPARPAAGRASLGAPGGQPGGRQSMGPPGVPGVNVSGSQMRTPVRPNGPAQMVTPTPMHPGYMSALSPVPIAPTPRKWYDRLADAVLGEEGDGTPGGAGGGAQNKYALICKKCFTHNGLVRESEVDSTQFICMKCGHFNPSPKSVRSGLGGGGGGGLGDDTPPYSSTNLASRLSLSDSPVSPSPSIPSMTASTTKLHSTSASTSGTTTTTSGTPQLHSKKGYRVDSDADEKTEDDDGMDVVPPTPAAAPAKGGKGRKSAAASGALKRTGSGRVTRNSRRSEVGEGMELD